MANDIQITLTVNTKGQLLKHTAKQMKDLGTETKKTTAATEKLGKTRDKNNRLEKGTAQISSNVTKNFSKMQQNIDGGGSGGLVRAYALLAANVFALTAAFGVLSRSAQIDTLIESMDVLTTQGGSNIEVLSRKMKEAAGNSIDLAQAFRQVSLASSAGLNTAEIEGLTLVAKGAAISLGRNLPDAMDRIFRGAIKLEPEILDEIGLFVRVDEAARKYGQTIGKSASALSQTEKRQAFLNEILEQGTRKFEEFAEKVQPDPYSRLAGALADIAQTGLSLVNMVLGPLANILGNNLPLLGTLFGVLVFTLVKKAIPALGQFNKGLADSANQALKAANDFRDKYAQAMGAASKKNIDNINKEIAKIKERREELMKGGPANFQSRAKGAAESQLKFSRATSAKGKFDANKERMDILKNSLKHKRLTEESEKIIKKELGWRTKIQKNLAEQIKQEQKLVEQEKMVTEELKKGTFAYRERAKLQSNLASATMVSNATNMAETQGVRKGFNMLWKDVKKGTTVVDGQTVALTKTGRAMTLAKGSASILSVGISNMMATIMPWVMIMGVVVSLATAFGKWMGVGGKAAQDFDKELKNLDKTLDGINKRFAEQVARQNDQTGSYLQVTKGAQAFATAQLEISTQMETVITKFEEWEEQANWFVKWWDGFKNDLGKGFLPLPDDWSFINTKEMAAEEQLGRAIANKFLGYIRAGSKEQIELVNQLIEGQEGYFTIWSNTVTNEVLTAAETLRKTETDMSNILKENTNLKLVYNKAFREGITLQEAEKDMYGRGSSIVKNANKNEIALLNTRTAANEILNDYHESIMDFEIGIDEAGSTIAAVNEIEEEHKRIIDSLVSSYEGATEAIGKFTTAFLPKTKVDEVTGSLMQMSASLKDATDVQRDIFFTRIEDSPFAAIMNKEEIDIIKKGGDAAFEAFKNVRNEFEKVQKELLHMAQRQKELNNLQKHYNKLAVLGGAQKNRELKMLEESLKITERMAEIEFTTFNRAEGETDLKLRLIATELKAAEDAIEFKAIAAKYDMEAIEAAQLLGSFEKLRVAEINTRIQLASSEIQQQKEALKLSMKVLETEKEYAEMIANTDAEVSKNLRLGSLGEHKLGAFEAANREMEAAERSRDFASDELKMKKQMIQLERKLLVAKLSVLEKELGVYDAKTNPMGVNKSQILADFDAIAEIQNKIFGSEGQEAITVAYKGAMRKAVKGAFESDDVRAGMHAAAQLFGEFISKENRKPKTKWIPGEGDKPGMFETTVTASEFGWEGPMMAARGIMDDMIERSAAFGPEGEFVSNFTKGALAIGDSFLELRFQFEEISRITKDIEDETVKSEAERMGRASAIAGAIGTAFSGLGDMLAANSARKTAAIDAEIEAEKRRDGKSKESLAKIAAMEKKKDALARKSFEQQKKVQMAVTVANTAAAMIAALAPDPMGFGNNPVGWAMAGLAAATGALQLAVISRQKYNGGSASDIQKPATTLSIGARNNTVDVSRGATGGELGYLRNQRGVGSNANNFNTGAAGYKNYSAGGEGIVVGERGPEVITPSVPIDVTPNDKIGGTANVNFTINAVDASGVEQLLLEQRGNIIGMIREAAHNTGNDFLEDVDTQALGGTGVY